MAILALAAGLRLVALQRSPPGLHMDEAALAWNAYCLLKTGADQHGVRWPIFESRGFGQGMTTLSLYALLPFQALGGLNVTTTRLPAAVGGIATVLLVYVLGRRLFGVTTGLVAAALLAVNPWHLQQSRWGHMAALLPLLVIAPVALLLWANLPPGESDRPPRAGRAALAGLAAGLGTYGYYAARLFLPVFLAGLVVSNLGAWRDVVRTRRGALAAAAFALAFALTFGPLAVRQVVDAQVSRRAQLTWVWDEGDSAAVKVGKAVARYPGHFGPRFLFARGDEDPALAPPAGYGLFLWFTLPLMAAGLVAAVRESRGSRAARFLLAWIVLYPAADLASSHVSLHALRSLPGVCALTLLAALGATRAWAALAARRPAAARAAAALLLAAGVLETAVFLRHFFGDFNDDLRKYVVNQADLMEAFAWVKPRLDAADAVYCTGAGMCQPYALTLVALGYDPWSWFNGRLRLDPGPPNIYANTETDGRYGNVRFSVAMSHRRARGEVAELLEQGLRGRVLLVMRPQVGLDAAYKPVKEIQNPKGEVVLEIYDLTFPP
jgi:hypothetical protein